MVHSIMAIIIIHITTKIKKIAMISIIIRRNNTHCSQTKILPKKHSIKNNINCIHNNNNNSNSISLPKLFGNLQCPKVERKFGRSEGSYLHRTQKVKIYRCTLSFLSFPILRFFLYSSTTKFLHYLYSPFLLFFCKPFDVVMANCIMILVSLPHCTLLIFGVLYITILIFNTTHTYINLHIQHESNHIKTLFYP